LTEIGINTTAHEALLLLFSSKKIFCLPCCKRSSIFAVGDTLIRDCVLTPYHIASSVRARALHYEELWGCTDSVQRIFTSEFHDDTVM
jgi:hypothetical protein